MSLKIVRSSNNAVLDNIFYQKTIANGCNYIYWHNPFFVGTKLYIINCNNKFFFAFFLYKR